MILTCPDCATRYFVDDRRLGPIGRTVRCAGCGSSWRAQMQAGPASPEEIPLDLGASDESARAEEPLAFKPVDFKAAEPLDPPAPEKAFRAKVEQRRKVARLAATGAVWAGLACAFGVILFLAFVFRVDVVRVFPRAAAAYALVRVNATGLQFEGVNAAPAVIDPSAVVVQGRVRNTVSVSAPVPMLRVALLDKRGFKLKTQILKLPNGWIAPGGTESFRTTFADPKAEAADVDVSFALDLAAKPKPLRRIQLRPPASGLSQPAPILRNAAAPGPAARPPTTAAALPPHAADGLRGLDTGGSEGVSPQPHG